MLNNTYITKISLKEKSQKDKPQGFITDTDTNYIYDSRALTLLSESVVNIGSALRNASQYTVDLLNSINVQINQIAINDANPSAQEILTATEQMATINNYTIHDALQNMINQLNNERR